MYFKSFTISQNAPGKNHAIYMLFLSGNIFASWKGQIKETPLKQLLSLLSTIHFEKVCIAITHFYPLLLCTQLIHGSMDSLRVAFNIMACWPGHNVAHTNWIATGIPTPKESSLNSQGIMGKVWVKSFDCTLTEWWNLNLGHGAVDHRFGSDCEFQTRCCHFATTITRCY